MRATLLKSVGKQINPLPINEHNLVKRIILRVCNECTPALLSFEWLSWRVFWKILWGSCALIGYHFIYSFTSPLCTKKFSDKRAANNWGAQLQKLLDVLHKNFVLKIKRMNFNRLKNSIIRNVFALLLKKVYSC